MHLFRARKRSKSKDGPLEEQARTGKDHVTQDQSLVRDPKLPPEYDEEPSPQENVQVSPARYDAEPPPGREGVAELEGDNPRAGSRVVIPSEVIHHPTGLEWQGPVKFEQCSNQIGTVIRLLEQFPERRARLLRSQLVSIQTRLSTWAQERDIVSVEQLESLLFRLPEAPRTIVNEICDRLRQWSLSSERRPLNEAPWVSGQSRTAYLELMIEGYDSLETFRTVCESLQALVPFLSNRQLVWEEQTSSTIQRPQEYTASSPVDAIDVSSSTNSIKPEPSHTQRKPSIQVLYLNCVEAIQAVGSLVADKRLSNLIRSRLIVWGCGIFEMENSLDMLLEEEDVESIVIFRSHVIGLLADIAVVLGRLLRSFSGGPDPELRKALNKLDACFGKFREFSEEAMDEEPDLVEQSGDGAGQDPTEQCLRQLSGLVDCLFDLLPSIDRLRQIWVLELERKSREMALAMSQAATLSAPEMYLPADSSESHHALSASQQVATTSRAAVPSSSSHSHLPGPADDNELDFGSRPGDEQFTSKGKNVPGASTPGQATKAGLRRHFKPSKPKDQLHKGSLRDIVAMDLELAVALRVSLNEARTRTAQNRQVNEDEELMIQLTAVQLKEWDDEIERLKSWSDAFEKGLGPAPSEAETDRLYSIFEQLAKIGGAFGIQREAPFGTNKTNETFEEKLKATASVMSKSGGKTIDVKVDHAPKDYKEALQAFREANDDIQRLGY